MALAPPSPDADELRALAAKYRQLAALRVQRDAAGATSRAALRALAARHPGCLRELDTLGLPELERRGRVAEAAAGGGPLEPWMAWVWAYHRLMQATLLVKREVGRGGAPADEARQRLRDEATRLAGWPLDDGFVTEVASPPQGRIGVLVLRRLACLFGAPAAEIARSLFPPRRDSPYTLG
jgi:hypothetical protein